MTLAYRAIFYKYAILFEMLPLGLILWVAEESRALRYQLLCRQVYNKTGNFRSKEVACFKLKSV